MVIEEIIDYIFYEESPDCLLLGIGVYDEAACETISKSFDVLFYAVFATVSALVFTRLVKMCIIFMKVIKYLFLVQSLDDQVTHDKNTTKKIFIWMHKLNACNEGFFGVGKKTICSLNVLSKLENHMEDLCDVFKGGIKIRMKEIFMVLLDKCRSRGSNNQRISGKDDIHPVELIFINNKYSRKSDYTANEKSYNTSSENKIKHNIVENSDIDEGVQEKSNIVTFATDEQSFGEQGITSSSESIKQKIRKGCFDPKNKYFHKIVHMMPVVSFPTCVLENRQMINAFYRFNNVSIKKLSNQSIKGTVNDNVNSSDCESIKSKENTLLSTDTKSETSNEYRERWVQSTKKATIKEKVKEIKRKDLLKYMKTLKSKRKKDSVFALPEQASTSSKSMEITDSPTSSLFKKQERNSELYDYLQQKNATIFKVDTTETHYLQGNKLNSNKNLNGDNILLWSTFKDKTLNFTTPNIVDINSALLNQPLNGITTKIQSNMFKPKKTKRTNGTVSLEVIEEDST